MVVTGSLGGSHSRVELEGVGTRGHRHGVVVVGRGFGIYAT